MPFLSGFYSKDTIIETIINSHTNSWALIITLIATILSAIYSIRIIYFTLTNFPRTKQKTHQETKPPIKPILRLTIGSIFIGTVTKLSTLQTTTITTIPKTIKLSAIIITLTGIILAIDLISTSAHQPPNKPKTTNLFFNQLAFSNTIHRTIPIKTLKISQQVSTELVDQ